MVNAGIRHSLVLIFAFTVWSGAATTAVFAQRPGPAPVTVPNVKNHTENAAEAALRSVGLIGSVTKEPNEANAGTVVDQRPPSGTKVPRGSSVTLTVSTGPIKPRTIKVPEVRKRSEKVALEILNDAGLRGGPVVREAHKAAPAGTVFHQEPAPDTVVPKPSGVKLWISTGPGLIPVPNVTNLQESDANDRLNAATLAAAAIHESHNSPAGTVFRQTPAANVEVPQRTRVSIWVSTGRVRVPDVRKQQEKEAYGALSHAGLRAGPIRRERFNASGGTVFKQEPDPNTEVIRESSVALWISTGQVLVPNVTNRSESEADRALRSAGLGSIVTSRRPNSLSPGRVIHQTPNPGTEVPLGTPVALTISTGAPPPNPTDGQGKPGSPLTEPPRTPTPTEPQVAQPLRPSHPVQPPTQAPEQPAAPASGASAPESQSKDPTSSTRPPGPIKVGAPPANPSAPAKPPTSPTVTLSIDATIITSNDEVTFNIAVKPKVEDAEYRVDFGDGNTTQWARESRVKHVYRQPGHYTPRGFSRAPDQRLFESRPLKLDVFAVSLATDAKTVTVNDELRFTASVKPEVQNLEYKFLFGDGIATDWTQNSSVKHVYRESGSRTARIFIRAKDQRELEGSGATIEVQDSQRSVSLVTGVIIGVGIAGTALYRWVKKRTRLDRGRKLPHLNVELTTHQNPSSTRLEVTGSRHLAWDIEFSGVASSGRQTLRCASDFIVAEREGR